MRLKRTFLIIGLAMLVIAIVFLAIALTHPELGTVFYIGKLRIGSAIWRTFYLCYLVIMLASFTTALLIKRKN